MGREKGLVCAASVLTAKKSLFLHFLMSPVEIRGRKDDPTRVGGVSFVKNTLEGPAGARVAVAGTESSNIDCELLLRSVGYKAVTVDGLPFDKRTSCVPNIAGKVGSGGLYVCGWLKRGPVGIIGTNITDAQETVGTVVADVASGRIGKDAKEGWVALKYILTARGVQVVDKAGWKRIEEEELRRGAASGKSREKISSIEEMLQLAGCK